VLALGTAAGLLTRPGCPVCHYAAEASDRYLAWFAAEAHADPVTITRLCGSLGMCARHTRLLMSQPGAAGRLTAVYRYLLQAAREQLAGPRGQRLAPCPACEHDGAAAGRALDTLLDGLSEAGVRERYLELGGLCWPHVRDAANGRGHRQAAAWAARVLAASTAGHRTSLEVLAGGPDYDADGRARLRAALPSGGPLPPGTCRQCLMGGHAELAGLARAAGATGRQECCLCSRHLRDVALMRGADAADVLGWQAECQAVVLARLAQAPARSGGNPAWWLRARRPPAAGEPCLVCLARERAVRWEPRQRRAGTRDAQPGHEGVVPLDGELRGRELPCVRHVLALRAADPAAGQLAAAGAARHADALIDELTEAFQKGTWAFRHESRGPEMTAWRRAAAFLDGGVFGGGPPQ
jgi:hypothetical protein